MQKKSKGAYEIHKQKTWEFQLHFQISVLDNGVWYGIVWNLNMLIVLHASGKLKL